MSDYICPDKHCSKHHPDNPKPIFLMENRLSEADMRQARRKWRDNTMNEYISDPIKYSKNLEYLKNDWKFLGPC